MPSFFLFSAPRFHFFRSYPPGPFSTVSCGARVKGLSPVKLWGIRLGIGRYLSCAQCGLTDFCPMVSGHKGAGSDRSLKWLCEWDKSALSIVYAFHFPLYGATALSGVVVSLPESCFSRWPRRAGRGGLPVLLQIRMRRHSRLSPAGFGRELSSARRMCAFLCQK